MKFRWLLWLVERTFVLTSRTTWSKASMLSPQSLQVRSLSLPVGVSCCTYMYISAYIYIHIHIHTHMYVYIYIRWDPLCPPYLRLWWGGVRWNYFLGDWNYFRIWLELYLRIANSLRKTYRTILMFAKSMARTITTFAKTWQTPYLLLANYLSQ